MAVRFAEVSARSVFNLTSPRWLPQLALNWHGQRGWHNKRYDPVRDMCERIYVDRFNEHSGHYEKLKASIQSEGIRNPVMLTTGRLLRRNTGELPPEVRKSITPVCEYVGGSRLYVAAALGISVPAIINDQANVFPDATAITHGDSKSLLQYFRDAPRQIVWARETVYANFLPYTHFDPAARGAQEAVQSGFRRTAIREILTHVQQWMNDHDHA